MEVLESNDQPVKKERKRKKKEEVPTIDELRERLEQLPVVPFHGPSVTKELQERLGEGGTSE